mgnify:CR=1 FL=1
MEIYQIFLIIVIISVIVSIGLYISQVIENNNYRANFAKINNCTYNIENECIDASGKPVIRE